MKRKFRADLCSVSDFSLFTFFSHSVISIKIPDTHWTYYYTDAVVNYSDAVVNDTDVVVNGAVDAVTMYQGCTEE